MTSSRRCARPWARCSQLRKGRCRRACFDGPRTGGRSCLRANADRLAAPLPSEPMLHRGTAMAARIFCAIVAGQAPAHRVLEDDVCIAFLDLRPLFPGHTLVIPRAHRETLRDVPRERASRAADVERAARVARARRGPRRAGDVRRPQRPREPERPARSCPRRPAAKGRRAGCVAWPRHKYASDDEAAAVAAKLRTAIAAIDG